MQVVGTALQPRHAQEAPVHDRADLVAGFDASAWQQCEIVQIGGGGLGGWVATNCVRKGVKRLQVFDADVVELSNLNRQRFFAQDLDKPKAVALVQNLVSECTEATQLLGHPFTVEEAIRLGIDVRGTAAVCSVDNDATRVFCARYFWQQQIPCLFIAVSADAASGYVFVQESRPGTPCWVCLHPEAVHALSRQRCTGATVDILQVMSGWAGYALDSLIMSRPRTWNYAETHLSGSVPSRTQWLDSRSDCPMCSTSTE